MLMALNHIVKYKIQTGLPGVNSGIYIWNPYSDFFAIPVWEQVLVVILTIVFLYGLYKLDKALKGPHPIWMFIPLLNWVELFYLADENPWKIAWILLPVIGWLIFLYYAIKVLVRITRKAGYSALYVLLLLVPGLNYFYPFIIMPKNK